MDTTASSAERSNDTARGNGASTVLGKLSPPITKMIRLDHSHVHAMVTSHKYTADASPGKKKAIVDTVCLALETHAQLEEQPLLHDVARTGNGLDEVFKRGEKPVARRRWTKSAARPAGEPRRS
jgi:hypothetical protein